jgi:uncharacterized membrane protein
MSLIDRDERHIEMKKITNTLQVVGGALVALVLAPVVALFGLTILGLAIGAAALLTGGITAKIWQHSRQADADAQDAEEAAPAQADAQPA